MRKDQKVMDFSKENPILGFPKYYVFMGGTVPPVSRDLEEVMRGGQIGGTKNLWRGDFGLKKSNICKICFLYVQHILFIKIFV